MIHDTPDNKGVNHRLVSWNNVWKFKYGARNEASDPRRERGLIGLAAFANRVRTELAQGRIPGSLRRQIYRARIQGWSFKPPSSGSAEPTPWPNPAKAEGLPLETCLCASQIILVPGAIAGRGAFPARARIRGGRN